MRHHIENNHKSYKCDICKKDVLEKEKKNHITKHANDKAFQEGIKKGKVSKMKSTKTAIEEKKEKGKRETAYSMF